MKDKMLFEGEAVLAGRVKRSGAPVEVALTVSVPSDVMNDGIEDGKVYRVVVYGEAEKPLLSVEEGKALLGRQSVTPTANLADDGEKPAKTK